MMDKFNKLIQVPNIKEFNPTEEIVNEAKSTLNEDQVQAFEGLLEFVNPTGDSLELYKSNMITITGYAGTGKTYMIAKFVSIFENARIFMTAPTNKAVKVLSATRTEGLDGIEYQTIHKMLALKLQWVRPKKHQDFKPYQKLVKIWGKTSELSKIDILIVDEVSMLVDELFFLLMEQNVNTKIIFLGDRAQIPPVGELDTIPLLEEKRKKYGIELFELKQVMRQANGSGILRTATSVRDNRFKYTDPVEDRTNTDDTIFYNPSDTKLSVQNMVKDFLSSHFSDNPDYSKVIAWRNETVDAFNQMIRQYIYNTKDLSYVMPNEKLIASSPIFSKLGGDIRTIILNTSDEFRVIDYTREVEHHYPNEDDDVNLVENLMGEMVHSPTEKRLDFMFLRARVEYILPSSEETVEYKIDILLPESFDNLKSAKSAAYNKKNWSRYESLMERFAQVNYNYAITAHKSQGSTYENVYIIEDDIDKNRNNTECNRIKYTAVSRASKKLHILSRRNK